MDLCYKEIRDCFRFERIKKDRAVASMFNLIERTLPIDKIDFFYPKNIFNDSGKLEFVFKINEKIVIVSETDDSKILMDIKYLSDVKNIKLLQESNHLAGNSLFIIFKDDFEIKCDSEIDSNESWKYKYKEAINELTKIFI